MSDPVEDALVAYLRADPDLSALLTRWADVPAIFVRYAPPEHDRGWESAVEYPHIDFAFAKVQDPQRRSSGTVTLNAYAPREAGGDAAIIAIEARLRGLLDGCALGTAEGFAGFRWETTTEVPGLAMDEFVGARLTFMAWVYTSQITFDPDPITTLNDWTIDVLPAARIAPQAWTPEQATPAVYWRYSGAESDWTEWSLPMAGGHMRYNFTAHILTPSTGETLRYARFLGEEAVRAGGLLMADELPLHFTRVRGDSSLDPLAAGQIMISTIFPVTEWPDQLTPTMQEVTLVYPATEVEFTVP